MTTINAAFFAYSSVGITSPVSTSGSQAASASQSSGSDIFGEAFSFSVSGSDDSSNAQGYSNTASSGSSSGLDTFEALFGTLMGGSSTQSSAAASQNSDTTTADNSDAGSELDSIFKFMDQILTSNEQALENIGSNSSNTQTAANTNTSTDANNSTDPLGQNSSDNSDAFGQLINEGGPLPAFLKQVDSSMHLDATQQASLQNIANEYANADDTPATVSSIAAALTQANI